MKTTRSFNGFSVTVGNMTGADVHGGWVIEEISINGQPMEYKSQAYATKEEAFMIARGIGNSAIDKLKRR